MEKIVEVEGTVFAKNAFGKIQVVYLALLEKNVGSRLRGVEQLLEDKKKSE